jgi:hypothetical protein
MKIISIILSLCVTTLTLLTLHSCEQKTKINELKDVLTAQSAELKAWRDDQNRSHTQTQTLVSNDAAMTRLIFENNQKFKELISDTRGLKRNYKNLENAVAVGFNSVYEIGNKYNSLPIDSAKTYAPGTDTGVVYYYQKDPYYTYHLMLKNNTPVQLDFTTTDTVTAVTTWYRKWLLGRKRFRTEFSNRNPHATIQYSQSIIAN